MSKGNIDAPKKSSGTKGNSTLVGQPGFEHARQSAGDRAAPGMGPGRGVGGAEHHKGSSFGGSKHSIRGANTSLPGGQVIK